MGPRFLYGFLDDTAAAPGFLEEAGGRALYWKEADGIVTRENLWESLGITDDWRPDFLLLRVGYAPLPPWLWLVPAPIVGVVEHLEQLWHHHRLFLPACALALAEPSAAERLRKAGIQNSRLQVLDFRLEDISTDVGIAHLQSAISNLQAPFNRQSRICKPHSIGNLKSPICNPFSLVRAILSPPGRAAIRAWWPI